MATKSNPLTNLPSLVKCVLALIGTALALYAGFYPVVSKMLTAPEVAMISSLAMFFTAIFTRETQIQALANDLPGVIDGTVPLTQAITDLKDVITGNTEATAANTAAAATPAIMVSGNIAPAPVAPAAGAAQ